MKGQCQLLGSEHRSVVLWVHSGVVAIPLFWVDVPSSSKSVRFGSQFSRMETYDEVEGGKKFRPTCLSMREDFGGSKVLKVPVVGDDVNRHTGTLKIVSPTCEGFNDRK